MNLNKTNEPQIKIIKTKEFLNSLKLIENNKNPIFITGKAGTGKSTLLKLFKLQTSKNVVILASTGIAAINISGQTIHSFFSLPPKLIKKDVIRRSRYIDTIKRLDTLVIDEISMVRADLMDCVDYALRINRGKMDIPFGGVHMVFFGDLFQLPPVVESDVKGYISENYKTPYFFSAKVFEKTKIKYIELNKVFRQSDKVFIDLLDKIRYKTDIEKTLDILNKRVKEKTPKSFKNYVTLTTTNNIASEINNDKLAKLPGGAFEYEATLNGQITESAYPTERNLKLKKGAQVILIMNDPNKRWANGTIALITDLSQNNINVLINGNTYSVPRMQWKKIEYQYNPEKNEIEEKTVATFEQYPIKLAWAITIHRSQGQTLDNVIIDMGYGAFQHGQVYVALSRCKSIEGIILKKPIIESDIIFDKRIYEFRDKFM